eukprot:gene27330-52671_t
MALTWESRPGTAQGCRQADKWTDFSADGCRARCAADTSCHAVTRPGTCTPKRQADKWNDLTLDRCQGLCAADSSCHAVYYAPDDPPGYKCHICTGCRGPPATPDYNHGHGGPNCETDSPANTIYFKPVACWGAPPTAAPTAAPQPSPSATPAWDHDDGWATYSFPALAPLSNVTCCEM